MEIDSIYEFVSPKLVLSDIYLKCETGDIVGIVGRNGSGKSLLMKIIFGVKKAEHQFIQINNKRFSKLYKRTGLIAYLPQHSFIPANLKVTQVLRFYLESIQFKDFNNDEIIQKIINNKIFELSGGELKYLEVKLLLKTKSKFVLLDEPFNHLSPKLREQIGGLILEASTEKGIIVTDHNYSDLEKIANKMYLMHSGSLKPVKDKQELIFRNYLPADK
jgi:ABC-type multidrug transport system ATPase subunit